MLAQQDVPVKDAQWYRISLKAKAEGMAGKTVTLALQNTQTWSSLFDYQSFTPTRRVADLPIPGAGQRHGRQETRDSRSGMGTRGPCGWPTSP